MHKFLLFTAAFAGTAACSSPSPEAADGFELLIDTTWSLEPGTEAYRCARRVIDEDIFITAARQIESPGTHHTVAGAAPSSAPDVAGEACGSPTTIPDLFGAGIGTKPLYLPPGVALPVLAGDGVWLNAHVYNPTEAALAGRSGIEVERMPPADVVHEARFNFYGPFSFEIPPNTEHTIVHETPAPDGRVVIGFFPHMHRLGSHFRAEVRRVDGSLDVIFDGPFVFDDQQHIAVDPLELHTGDTIVTTCTWTNPTAVAVHYGPSSDDEMCFTSLLTY